MPNNMELTPKQNDVLIYLVNFYKNTNYVRDKIIPIIHNKNRKNPKSISLRFIESFIFKYCLHRKVFIKKEDGTMMALHDAYKNQLNSYDKSCFDIFGRGQRILFKFDEGVLFETTIGQLNFFRWLIENNILTYIEKNKERIRQEIKIINEREREAKMVHKY